MGRFDVFRVCDAENLHPCASEPCMNLAMCIANWINASYATYKCLCRSNFTGHHCETGNLNYIHKYKIGLRLLIVINKDILMHFQLLHYNLYISMV